MFCITMANQLNLIICIIKKDLITEELLVGRELGSTFTVVPLNS